MKTCYTIGLLLLLAAGADAQQYTALNGSSFTGSLNVHQNPAAMVNAPGKWDLTLLGIQDKHSTNIVQIRNYSLLSNPANSEYLIQPGKFKRYGRLNANLNLLNGRVALDKKSAVAFGINLRANADVKSSEYDFIDTLGRFEHFFNLNQGAKDMQVNLASSSWLEFYAAYGRTIMENETGRLNAGATVKINRGLSGIFTRLWNGNFIRTFSGTPNRYLVTDAPVNIGYSSNFDRWDPGASFGSNFRRFISFTETGFSFDLGLEYLVKSQAVTLPYDEEEAYYDYDWKFGVSLLDAGYAQYHFGKYSVGNSVVLPGITDTVMDRKFDSTIYSMKAFKDSLNTAYEFTGTFEGKYRIHHPTHLVFNADRYIGRYYYINIDLSLDMARIVYPDNFRVRDLNLLTVTPRWETRKKGFYMPFYFNNLNQLWVGGAVRMGPVLFGVHNWANLFSKKKMARGGGYLAIILRTNTITAGKTDKRLNCPR